MVYSNELDIKRIVQIRQRVREIKRASREIKTHLTSSAFKSKVEIAWQKVERAINVIEQTTDPQKIERIDQALENLRAKVDKKPTPQYYDAKASLEFHRGNNAIAERFWKQAIELNPNFYKTYNKLISFYNATHQDERALDLIRKMQTLNKNNISRIVKMGEIYNKLKKEDKAEHCFKSALTRDKFCSQALNGLAEIKFRQGNLDESRNLLAQSRLAYKMATTLNQQGIELVNEGSYEDALKHYSKAQFVLPQQDKGPMLFYNIGLCYSKWGKPEIAQQFLKIALIKAPEYAKAKKLLSQL
jgi:tetratricopeptide (TPR) repeat protein